MGVKMISDTKERTKAGLCNNIVVRRIFASRRNELVGEA
jgi:hypothetical protein